MNDEVQGRAANIEHGIINGEAEGNGQNASWMVNDIQEQYRFDLEERLITFAVSVCTIAEKMPANRVGDHVAGQLIRSGTAPAPNYGEAQAAESRRDFIHKLKIGLKELRETNVWLKFIRQMELYEKRPIDEALKEADELIAIFVKSIATARQNARRNAKSVPSR